MGEHSLLDLLQAFLREKHLLLLLDNFEQVVRAGVQVAELLAACPRFKVLVTSRMTLHVRAEHEFAVPPLALPDLKRLPNLVALAQYEVVALFIQRAQAVKSDFQITSANAPAIAEICVRLDGLPLAIELAAARMKLLSPEALLARLGQRLQVLTGGARDVAERHQTLRNAIAWSYQLLDSQEQQLFRRLSIFVGGCTLEAVEAISAAPGDGAESALDTIASLVDKSLLQRMEQAAQEEPRFVMLETIREYGLERLEALGEIEEVRKAHAAYFLALAEEAYLKTDRPEQSVWLRRLDREHDNLHAVMSWSLEQTGSEKEMALRLGIVLRPFWDTRGYYSEGREFLERALVGSDDVEDAVQAGALPPTHEGQMRWQGLMALGFLWTERDYAQAGTWFRRASDLADRLADPTLRARSLNRVGNWHLNVERPLEALAHHQEALNIFQELEDQPGIAETLDLLGMASYLGGDLIRGTAYYQQAIALFSELGDRQGLTSSLATLTMRGITYQTDTMIPAVTHVSEVIPDGELALKIARATDQRAAEAYALIFLAFCLGPQGDYTQALEYAGQGLLIAEEIDHRQWMTAAHCALGALYRDLLALPQAQQHLEQALHQALETRSSHWIHAASGHLASTYILANVLPQAENTLKVALIPTTPTQTLGQRLMWCARAELALARNDPSQALQIIEQLMTPAAHTGESRDILRLARLRGEALTALNRASEAEELLQHARKVAQRQGALPLLWRLHLALGKCYQTQRYYEAAEESFLAARDILEQLAPHVPGEPLRADFLEQSHHLLFLKPPSPKRAAKRTFDRPTAREAIEQELRTAQLIQRSLLPEALPRLSGWRLATYYQPASEVGGDFYDFIPFEDGRLGLLIGDASGKGIPAALVMTTTCTMLRTAAQATASPSEVLARVNDLLSARIPSGMFVTCFYALLDPRSERLRYANAGQDLPYRCHGNGVSKLRATGMPLGLMPGSSYEEQEVTIAPGESILFYSDGLVEAHNPSREMFGFPRLQTLLAEHADGASLIDFLLGELKRFTSDGWEQEDDVTLLLLQRMAEPAPA